MAKNFARAKAEVLLSALLAAVLHVEFAQALRCYSCQEPTTAEKCMAIVNCSQNDLCKMTMYFREEVYPFVGDTTVTRPCSSSCIPSGSDEIGLTRHISYCSTDLCNGETAASMQVNYVAAWTSAVSFFILLS